MVKILKEYFLPNWIGLSILFLLKSWVGESEMSLRYGLILGQLMALVLTLIIGSIYYLSDTKWGPNRRKKLLNKSPFIEFKNLGFKEEDNYLIGNFKNYLVMVSYTWRGSRGIPSISIFIFYNFKKSQTFMSQNKLKDLNKRYKKQKLEWFVGFVKREWSFNFKPPKFKEIQSSLEFTTQILKQEQFLSINKTNYEAMCLEYQLFLNSND